MASDDKYEFNAPKFVDFEAADLHMGDTDHYFAYDHESGGYVIEEDVAVAKYGEFQVESVHATHNYSDSGMSGSEELHYESVKDDHVSDDEQFRPGSSVDDYELYEVQYACARRSSVCGAEEIVTNFGSREHQPRRRSASVSNTDVLIAETPEVLQRIDARLGRKYVVVPEARRLNLDLDQESVPEDVKPAVDVYDSETDDVHISRLDRKFATMLRKVPSPAPMKKPVKPHITEPKPFSFASDKLKSKPSASKAAPSYENVPLAEAMLKLQKATPQRFRSKPANARPEIPKAKPVPHVTQAHTPTFATDKRHRPVHVVSREEQEAKELEEIRKHQFKAHPVKPKVMKAKPIAMQPVKRPVTQVHPFKLSEPQARRVQVVQDKPTSHIFHARPAPMKALHAFKPERPHSPKCTIPQTPNFSSAGKAAMAARRRNLSGVGSTSSLNSVSNSSNHSDEGQRPRVTKPQPFSFADREKLMMERKQERIMKHLEEQKALQAFHANPLPDLSRPKGVPARPAPSRTQVKPFHLSTETLGQQKLTKFYAEQAENDRKAREAAEFKAHKPVVLEKAPFVPQRPGRILTEVAEFRLNTEVRAEKRMEFEEHLKEKEQEILAAMREAEENRRREEEEERARLRAQAIVKANPIRHYKPVEIKGSDRSLTVPETPHFRSKTLRERKVSANENSFASQ